MTNTVLDIIKQLERELATAANSSRQAHDSATHSENIADNKYDTLALEAAYLAHGQSVRIVELQETIHLYKNFQPSSFTQQSLIQLGARVDIQSEKGDIQRLFIGPAAGGLCIEENGKPVNVITAASPIGQVLLNKGLEDEIALMINKIPQSFTVIDIK